MGHILNTVVAYNMDTTVGWYTFGILVSANNQINK